VTKFASFLCVCFSKFWQVAGWFGVVCVSISEFLDNAKRRKKKKKKQLQGERISKESLSSAFPPLSTLFPRWPASCSSRM